MSELIVDQDPAKLAYSLSEFLKATGLGRTRFYAEVNAGRLRVTKSGRRSLILVEHARDWTRAIAGAAA